MRSVNGNNVLKCYIVDENGSKPIDIEDFLPAVGYIKDNEITDFMYDSFIFLPQPNYLYNHSPGGDGKRKPLKKDKWLEYIDKDVFMPGKNMDALDSAVGIVKNELDVKDYQATVFPALFYPHILVRKFGEVNGKNLDLSDMECRKEALKWMVDYYIYKFRQRGYQNIKIGGFYWFAENIVPNDGNEDFLPCITDYIRKLGYTTIWSVWFRAPGYNQWRELGFDAIGYQPNFFPEHRKDWPNRGTEERLTLVSETVEKLGVGVEIEMADADEESALVVKKYYHEGFRSGWINAFHIYYMSTGPKLLRKISESDNPIVRSAYTATYLFIQNKYDPDF